jgi:respiratory nitrate reductase gamma subunit
VMVLLAFMVVTGMWNTVVENLINGGYNYRETVSPWFRGLFLLDPNASLMTRGAIPLSYQLHAIGGWLLIMVWPFSRLVHAWSVPVAYLRRKPIVYRSRAPLGVRVGTGGVSSDTAAHLVNPPEGAVHVRQ